MYIPCPTNCPVYLASTIVCYKPVLVTLPTGPVWGLSLANLIFDALNLTDLLCNFGSQAPAAHGTQVFPGGPSKYSTTIGLNPHA